MGAGGAVEDSRILRGRGGFERHGRGGHRALEVHARAFGEGKRVSHEHEHTPAKVGVLRLGEAAKQLVARAQDGELALGVLLVGGEKLRERRRPSFH